MSSISSILDKLNQLEAEENKTEETKAETNATDNIADSSVEHATNNAEHIVSIGTTDTTSTANDIINNSEQTADTADISNNDNNNEYSKSTTKSFNMMVNYIKEHKEDIPEGFRGTVLFNEDNLSLATYWVYIMKLAPVPVWMRHDPDIVDNHGWTIAQHYIMCNNEPPPQWMIHNPTIQNVNGRTTAMMLLLYRNSKQENEDIPSWMVHDINICDSLGYSLVDYWLANNSDDLPEWILEQIEDKKHWTNKLHENIAISYMIRRGCLPPEEYRLTEQEANEFKTIKGNTYNEIWNYINSKLNNKKPDEQPDTN